MIGAGVGAVERESKEVVSRQKEFLSSILTPQLSRLSLSPLSQIFLFPLRVHLPSSISSRFAVAFPPRVLKREPPPLVSTLLPSTISLFPTAPQNEGFQGRLHR